MLRIKLFASSTINQQIKYGARLSERIKELPVCFCNVQNVHGFECKLPKFENGIASKWSAPQHNVQTLGPNIIQMHTIYMQQREYVNNEININFKLHNAD